MKCNYFHNFSAEFSISVFPSTLCVLKFFGASLGSNALQTNHCLCVVDRVSVFKPQ